MILKERLTGVHINISTEEITDIIYMYNSGYTLNNIVKKLKKGKTAVSLVIDHYHSGLLLNDTLYPRNNISAKLPVYTIKQIADRSGAQTIGISSAECLGDMMEELIKQITLSAEKYATHAGRKTILPKDIAIVVEDMGINIHVPIKTPKTPKATAKAFPKPTQKEIREIIARIAPSFKNIEQPKTTTPSRSEPEITPLILSQTPRKTKSQRKTHLFMCGKCSKKLSITTDASDQIPLTPLCGCGGEILLRKEATTRPLKTKLPTYSCKRYGGKLSDISGRQDIIDLLRPHIISGEYSLYDLAHAISEKIGFRITSEQARQCVNTVKKRNSLDIKYIKPTVNPSEQMTKYEKLSFISPIRTKIKDIFARIAPSYQVRGKSKSVEMIT